MTKQKIYFIPLYDYLSIPDFQKILSVFNTTEIGKKYHIKLLNIHHQKNFLNDGKAKLDESIREIAPFVKEVQEENLFHNKISFKKIYLQKIKPKIRNNRLLRNFKKYILDNDFIFNLIFFPYHLIIHLIKKNLYEKIYTFLKYENPAAIIVSSDLANLNIRFSLLAAHSLKIPIIIYWMGDIETPKKKMMKKFKKYSYINALYFNENHNNIIGMYAYDATIFVSNAIAKQKLINATIESNRIKIILPNQPENKTFDGSFKHFGHTKFIVYYTENLHSIYGEKYLMKLHTFLATLFIELHNDYGIQCIVRPHPMEREGPLFTKFIEEPFLKPEITIDSTLSLEYLTQNAMVNIAHFSKVLLDTLLLGNNILSINIQKCNRTFIPEDNYSLLEASSFKDLREALINLLSNEQFFKDYQNEHLHLKNRLLEGAEPFDKAFLDVIKKGS